MKRQTAAPRLSVWVPPPTRSLKFNVDGASIERKPRTKCIVIRNFKKEISRYFFINARQV